MGQICTNLGQKLIIVRGVSPLTRGSGEQAGRRATTTSFTIRATRLAIDQPRQGHNRCLFRRSLPLPSQSRSAGVSPSRQRRIESHPNNRRRCCFCCVASRLLQQSPLACTSRPGTEALHAAKLTGWRTSLSPSALKIPGSGRDGRVAPPKHPRTEAELPPCRAEPHVAGISPQSGLCTSRFRPCCRPLTFAATCRQFSYL